LVLLTPHSQNLPLLVCAFLPGLRSLHSYLPLLWYALSFSVGGLTARATPENKIHAPTVKTTNRTKTDILLLDLMPRPLSILTFVMPKQGAVKKMALHTFVLARPPPQKLVSYCFLRL
jgi:hypothetical protein